MSDLKTTIGLDDRAFRRDLARADRDAGRMGTAFTRGLSTAAKSAAGVGAALAVVGLAASKAFKEYEKAAKAALEWDKSLGRVNSTGEMAVRNVNTLTMALTQLRSAALSSSGQFMSGIARSLASAIRDARTSGVFGSADAMNAMREPYDLQTEFVRRLEEEIGVLRGTVSREQLDADRVFRENLQRIRQLEDMPGMTPAMIKKMMDANQRLYDASGGRKASTDTVFTISGLAQIFGNGNPDFRIQSESQRQRDQIAIRQRERSNKLLGKIAAKKDGAATYAP